MTKVSKVTIQLRRPRGQDPGQVAYGFYKVEDNTVIMTDADGNPAGAETGKTFSRKLRAGEDPVGAACTMTRDLRSAFRSGSDRMDGFEPGRRLHYPRNGSIV
jgi:hypothetical protein